ncbi:MAG: hypothetical protein ACRDNK_23055 [Solirubrobacteraceae bacterium]
MRQELVAAGAPAEVVPGDLVFVRRRGPIAWMIQLGQSIRPSLRPWRRLTHVAVVVADGAIIEARARGVVRSPLSEYADRDRIIVHTGLTGDDLAQALAYLHAQLGERYGLVTFVGTGLRMLTPGRGLWFGGDATQICSGLAATALERGWFVFEQVAASLCPAELARALAVNPHAYSTTVVQPRRSPMSDAINTALAKLAALLGPLSPFTKAVVPAALALATAIVKSFADGRIDATSVTIAASGVALAIVAYLLPNLPKPTPAPAPPAPPSGK